MCVHVSCCEPFIKCSAKCEICISHIFTQNCHIQSVFFVLVHLTIKQGERQIQIETKSRLKIEK